MNYALRVLKPVLDGSAASVEPKLSAEDDYTRQVQAACQDTVWHSGGCNSVRSIYFFPRPGFGSISLIMS